MQVEDLKRLGIINMETYEYTPTLSEQTTKKIAARVFHADQQHPEGANYFALTSEVAEVYEALRVGDVDSTVYELYDVIAVCLRMIRDRER